MKRLNVVDKKQTIARGFADVNTPSCVENELLYSWQERKEMLQGKIDELSNFIKSNGINKETKSAINQRAHHQKQLQSLGKKICNRVDFHLLLIDRLKDEITQEQFDRACFLAREDKSRILSKISI